MVVRGGNLGKFQPVAGRKRSGATFIRPWARHKPVIMVVALSRPTDYSILSLDLPPRPSIRTHGTIYHFYHLARLNTGYHAISLPRTLAHSVRKRRRQVYIRIFTYR